MTDPYEVLQVRERAEPEVIQAAFRALARKYHPDFGGGPERMIALNEAWEIIGNKKRRAAYDLLCQAAGTAPAPAVVHTPAAATYDAYASRSAPTEAGSILDFGRYAGVSIGRLAAEDPTYLEWLARASVGRRFAREIRVALGRRAPIALKAPLAARPRWGRGR
jgi:curved DNA-binding protein CbpA